MRLNKQAMVRVGITFAGIAGVSYMVSTLHSFGDWLVWPLLVVCAVWLYLLESRSDAASSNDEKEEGKIAACACCKRVVPIAAGETLCVLCLMDDDVQAEMDRDLG